VSAIKDIYSVVIRPLVTEKGTHQSERRNVYAFEVSPTANKAQIKQAVEKIYNVKVLEVRTANRKGKARRYGRRTGTTSRWKKAVVVLHSDQHIDLF
jgi:large subunit ribosomal protein L23